MKKILFLFSFFLFFLINPKIAFSLSADFTSHPCLVNFIKEQYQEAVPVCLELINKMEGRPDHENDINYFEILYFTSLAASRNNELKIAEETYNKLFSIIDENLESLDGELERPSAVYDLTLIFRIFLSYADFLINTNNAKLGEKILDKYYPLLKKNPRSNFTSPSAKDLLVIDYEVALSYIFLHLDWRNATEQEYLDAIKKLEDLIPTVTRLESSMGSISPSIKYAQRANIYFTLSKFYRSSIIDKDEVAEDYILKVYELSKKYQLSFGIFYSLYQLVLLNDLHKDDPIATKKYALEALKFADQHPQFKRLHSYVDILDIVSGVLFDDEHKFNEAYTYSKEAVESIIKNHTDISNLTQSDKNFLRTHIFTIEQLLRQPKDNFPYDLYDEFFRYVQLLPSLETGKALQRLEIKRYNEDKHLSKIYKQKQEKDQEIASLRSQIQSLRTTDNDKIDYKKFIALNSQIKDLKQILSSLHNELLLKIPDLEGINMKTINVREVMRMLNPDEAMFIFYQPYKVKKEYDEEEVIFVAGAVITQKRIMPLWNPQLLKREHLQLINNHLNFSTDLYQRENFPYESSFEVYKSLFGGAFLDENVPEDMKNIKDLIIINDGILHHIPYWALITESPPKKDINDKSWVNIIKSAITNFFDSGNAIKNQPWLSKKFSITITPSVKSFVNLRKRHKKMIGIEFSSTSGDFGIGMMINKVAAQSPGEKIGLQKDDIIIAINNKEIKSENDIINIPKDNNIDLLILRGNKELPFTVPPLINKNEYKEENYFDFVGIGNPSGLKENSGELSNLLGPFSFNDVFQNNNTLQRGVNIRAIEEMPALPGTEKELRAIASFFNSNNTKLLLQKDASEIAVKKEDLSNTKYIAFSTHAVVAGEMRGVDEPGIILTPPKSASKENDGLLTASEIMNLDLNAELVILSACNTGSGITASSEGLTGLTKSFFYAGANQLIISNWRVTDKYASRLTTNMIKHLTNENTTMAQALQVSINKLIEENLHPIFWGPFMLVGNGI